MTDLLAQLVPAVVLRVGSLVTAVPTREVQRFILVRQVSPLPRSPAAVLGLSVIGGEAAMVIDLALLLDQPPPTTWPANLGLWGKPEAESLVLVGGQVRWVGRLRRASEPVEGSCFTEAVEWKGSTVPLLVWSEVLEACLRR